MDEDELEALSASATSKLEPIKSMLSVAFPHRFMWSNNDSPVLCFGAQSLFEPLLYSFHLHTQTILFKIFNGAQ